MRVEPRIDGVPPIFFLSPPRDGDQIHPTVYGIGTEVPGERIPVHPRHPDVEHSYLREEFLRNTDGVFTADGDRHIMATLRQKGGKQLPAFDIVVSNQNAQPLETWSFAHDLCVAPLCLTYFFGRSTIAAALALERGAVPDLKPFC